MTPLTQNLLKAALGILLVTNVNIYAAPFSNGSLEIPTDPDFFGEKVEPNTNSDYTLCNVNHSNAILSVRANNIASWLVTEGGVDWIDGDYQSPPWPGASNGNRYIDLSGNPACNPAKGSIEQEFDTIVSRQYDVYFDMSGNPDNGTATKALEVSAGGEQGQYSFDFPGGNTLPWQGKVFSFTATGSSTTLRFESLVNSAWGPLLDNVRVEEEQPLAIAVDIKPGGCPNSINTKSKGVTPVAIMNTGLYPLDQIDIATLRLESVAAVRSAIEDVGTPYEPYTGKQSPFDCNTYGPDGYADITLKFATQELVAAMGVVEDGDVRILTLTGLLTDGETIEGEDVIVIFKKGK